MPGSRLDEIVQHKRVEVAARKAETPTTVLERSVEQLRSGRFIKSITQGRTNLICEIKPKSPSAGVLKETISIEEIVSQYDKFASAISVLTDEKYFGGSLDLLRRVNEISGCPTLCKDFVIDRHQCFEARLAGAEAVLLIVKILDENELHSLHKSIKELGMVPVVEVQTEDELRRAVALGPEAILINNRDLTTFEIDLATTEKLANLVPRDAVLISASGIESRSDIERLSAFCNAFLIGSSLMRAGSLESKLRELCAEQPCEAGQ